MHTNNEQQWPQQNDLTAASIMRASGSRAAVRDESMKALMLILLVLQTRLKVTLMMMRAKYPIELGGGGRNGARSGAAEGGWGRG